MMDLTDGSVVVTGGASGLGGATVARLARRAARVVILDRDEAKGEELAARTGARFCATDVTDEAAVSAALEVALEGGPLRAAICCAGVGWAARVVNREGKAHPLDLFAKVVQVNLVGTFNVARLAAEAMAGQMPLPTGDRGALVFTASIAGFEGQKGQAAYAASKAGVIGLVLPMARDLSSRGIRVVAVAPGTFSTPMLHGLKPEQVAALEAEVVHPSRLGEPEEFAAMVETILDASYLNGTVVRLDGALRLG